MNEQPTQRVVGQQISQAILRSRTPGEMSGFCTLPSCPVGPQTHVHSCHGVLTRSKSLDDLISLSFLSDDSCSSDCFGTNALTMQSGCLSGRTNPIPPPLDQVFGQSTVTEPRNAPSQPYSLYQQQDMTCIANSNSSPFFTGMNPNENEFLSSSLLGVRNSQGLPLHHHSHHHLQYPLPSNSPPIHSQQQPHSLDQVVNTTNQRQPRDALMDKVLQGMDRLEMN